MFQKILSYVNQHHMLTQGDGVVAGVSGGADSVCLLFVLRRIQESLGGKLYVAHVNHGLRGEEALADQEFVRRLCKEWQLPFYLKSVNLREFARERKLTEEEAGRLVRYDFFRQVAEETGAAKIAVGHNANDNAETLLFHLTRGSSLKGLGGISPVQGAVIRPLLCVKREEIEQYLKENGLRFCMDKTNLEDTYTRNRIRHKLLPLMEEINPGVVEAIGRAAGDCAMAADFLEAEAEAAFAEYVVICQGLERLEIRKEAFAELHPAVADELLMRVLSEISGSRKDIGAVHIGALRALQAGETGKFLNLPYGVTAENQYGKLVFHKKENNESLAEYEITLALPENKEEDRAGEISLPNGGKIQYAIENYEKSMKIPKNRYTKWLNYDIINGTLRFRTRRTGDWIQVFTESGRKKLKDYLVNEKVPRSERDQLVLLAEGDEILWIAGYRLSEKVKVKEDTKRILKLTYTGGNADGENSSVDFSGECRETHRGTCETD